MNRRNHYVPRFVLNRWSDEQKRVLRFDVETGQRIGRTSTAARVAFERGLYPLTDTPGGVVDPEKILSAQVETPSARLLAAVIDRTNGHGGASLATDTGTQVVIRHEDELALQVFLTVQFLRTKKNFSALAPVVQALWKDDFADISPLVDAEEFARDCFSKALIDDDEAKRAAQVIFRGKRVALLVSRQDDPSFVLGDVPVVLRPPQGSTRNRLAPQDGDVEILMPISPHMAISFAPESVRKYALRGKVVRVDEGRIYELNRLSWASADSEVFSNDPAHPHVVRLLNDPAVKELRELLDRTYNIPEQGV